MDTIIHACSGLLATNSALWLSVMLAGLVGSASHCSVMCSPMVASQLLMREKPVRASSLLFPYHLGRASTYMLLGIVSTLAAAWLFGENFKQLQPALLCFAGGLFILSALRPHKTHSCCGGHARWINRIPSAQIRLFLRGMLMGFMPCGMVVSVLLLVSATGNPLQAAMLMLLFAAATTPLLQAAGLGLAKMSGKLPITPHNTGRIAMGLNGLMLCLFGLNLGLMQ